MKQNFKKVVPFTIRDRKWTAVFAPIPTEPDGSQLYGDSHHAQQMIRVSTNMHPQVISEIIWHECLHACYSTTGLDRLGGKEEEEDIVVGLSNALSAFVADNPELVALASKLHRMEGW